MIINLIPLFQEQVKLDHHIQEQHQVTYQSTREKRLLALLVEVGEMINETKTFKFWSKKPSADKPIILDEYADGLHFFLSLGIEIGSEKTTYEVKPFPGNLTQATLLVFDRITALKQGWTISLFEQAFQAYVDLVPLLNFTTDEVVGAYFQKLGVNYTRQQNQY